MRGLPFFTSAVLVPVLATATTVTGVEAAHAATPGGAPGSCTIAGTGLDGNGDPVMALR